MANNKIVYGDQTLIDLTSDTVTPETLAMGETAHSASGAQIVGTMSPSGPTTPLTPSNSDPPSIVDGTAYTADGDGYAIESYSSITPSNEGTQFNFGINKMSESGYAYKTRPSETILWTNSNPTSDFSETNVTLSSSIDDYDYIKIIYRGSTTFTEQYSSIWSKSDVKACTDGASNTNRLAIAYRISANYARPFAYISNTTLYIGDCFILISSGKYNSYCIPIQIIGIKGNAIPGYNSITPSNLSPVSLTSGDIYKMDDSGYAIESYNTKTPSSTPVSVSSGEIDKMGGNGYLINSYANVTPSADGTYFSSGMKKMSTSGYAYTGQVTLKATTLWTNSSPTSAFSGSATLSQSYKNFSYIGIKTRASTSSDTSHFTIYPVSEFQNFIAALTTYGIHGLVGGDRLYYSSSSAHTYVRCCGPESDTSITFGTAYNINNSGETSTKFIIPIEITGYKISA